MLPKTLKIVSLRRVILMSQHYCAMNLGAVLFWQ